jgi:hypothetical protein
MTPFKRESVTLSISEKDKAELEKIALKLGILWGDKPSISGLVKAIAQHRLILTEKPHNKELEEAIALIQEGINKLNQL